MAKQQINRKETKVATQEGLGQQFEQIVTVDDNTLPSAQELADYKLVDPRIVEFLMETSKKEQAHRHKVEDEKVKIVKHSERRVSRMNWWGMFFAFMALITLVGLAAYALYLDKQWFAGIFGLTAVVSILSVFVEAGKKNKE